ncbi:MAG: hypothetical protein L0Z62_03655 [Gemmataceae bacterium]|nr:hypothetical protein [Gemmataceae bacterium]
MNPVKPIPASECAWALETILEGHDRPTDETAAQRLRAHLEQCSECRRIESCERRLTEVLGMAPVPPTPADFHQRVRGLVRGQRLRRLWSRLAVTSAAALLLALALPAAVLWWRGPPAPPRGEPMVPTAVAEPEEERFLASLPPVEPLVLLERQQQAYLDVLAELEEGF